jgi:hypothetical protein
MLEDEEDEDGPCAIFAAPSMCCARDSGDVKKVSGRILEQQKNNEYCKKGHGTRFEKPRFVKLL